MNHMGCHGAYYRIVSVIEAHRPKSIEHSQDIVRGGPPGRRHCKSEIEGIEVPVREEECELEA